MSRTPPSSSPSPSAAPGIVEVFADGSCVCNGKKDAFGGIGVFFGSGDPRNVSECLAASTPPQKKVTNQTAELTACLEAVRRATTRAIKLMVPVHVFTDSSYVVDSMTKWAPQWERNGWRTRTKAPVKNLALVKALYEAKKRFGVAFFRVNAHRAEPPDVHSREHALWYGNRMADALAVRGTQKCSDSGRGR